MPEESYGVVASGHPDVCAAAATLLRAGGNAFDAAIAAGFAASVVEPALTSLGGGGYLLARPSDGSARLFDFFVDTPGRGRASGDLEPHFFPVTVRFPASNQEFNVGLGSVATPGNLKGFLHVQRRLGRACLADVLAPAIQLARDGCRVNSHQAYFLELLRPIMTLDPAGREVYAPGGDLLALGDRLVNPDAARFLESVARDGDREFYEGEIATRIETNMRERNGLVTREDLSAYEVIEREPLAIPYRGRTLLTNPPPSLGGAMIGLSLELLAAHDFGAVPFGSAAHLNPLAEVLEEVERRRHRVETGSGAVRSFPRGTTHVSVSDSKGNVASMTTSNGEGSGYVVPGIGVMLNNMMGEDDLHPDGFHASPPGLRVASMMSPSVVLKDGSVELVLGSGGSKRIRSAMLQVISAVVDFDLPLARAVEAPRVHWDGDQLQMEPGYSAEVLASLTQSRPVNPWPRRDVYFGGVHAVVPGGVGAGDSRRGGAAKRV